MKVSPRFWLQLAGALLLATACGSGSDSDPTASVSPTPFASPTVRPTPSGPTAVPGPGVTNAQILIGMSNDMSGAGQTPYAAITEAALAYFEMANQEQDGVCGRDVFLQVEDDSYAPHLALDRARKLVEQNQVLAMIGAVGTEVHQPVAPYLNDPNGDGDTSDGVPDLFVTTGWAAWGDSVRFPWTTTLIPDFITDAAVLGEYIEANFAGDNVAILYKDDVFGRNYSEALSRVIGGSLAQQGYDSELSDVSTQIQAIQGGGADVVVLASTPEITISAIQAAQAINYDPQWLISYTNPPSALATQLGGSTGAEELAEGFRQLDGVVMTSFLLSAIEDAGDPAMVEHTRIMETYDGPPVSSLSVYGQTLGEATVETLSRACANLTRPGVMQAAESLVGYRTSLMLPEVEINLSAADHFAIQGLQPLQIMASGEILPDGDFIDLEPDSTPTPIATRTPAVTLSPTPTAAPPPAETPVP